MEQLENPDFNRISSTALLCASIKAKYTDLPYMSEIYKLVSRNEKKVKKIIDVSQLDRVVNGSSSSIKKLSILEGRHLAINDVIESLENSPVLELSSGLSSRYLEFSDRCLYIETDLQKMILLKRKVVKQIVKKSSKFNPNHILPLNPINKSELLSFGKYFVVECKENPIVIINEGLLMYLSIKEQRQLRDNIAAFLGKYSPTGYWITTDFSSRKIEKEDVEINKIMNEIEEETGRKFNRFQNDDQVHKFLHNGGLKGEPLPNHHLIDKLSCLEKLQITKDEARSVANMYKAWRITLI